MSRALQIVTYIVTWSSFLVAIASCILRIYCCRCIKRRWKADDFMSLVVGVFLVGALGLWQRAFLMGCAGPEPNDCNYLNPSGDVLMWFFVTSIIYDAVLHFIIRAAFFTFYWSLSAQSNFRFWTGLGFGADVMLLIFNILIIVFRCQPTTANFRPLGRLTAQCMDSSFALFAPAAMNSLLNLYVLLLPIPIFYRVQVPLRRKMHICCMFAIGGAAVTLGFIRMHSLKIINSGTDTSKAVGETMIVGALGMSLAAVAHNLPSLRVFWKHIPKRRLKVKSTSQPPFNTRPRKLPSTSLLGTDGTVYDVASFSRPVYPSASKTSLVDRPLPTLPAGARPPRYPVVNEDFGSGPRTPPSVAWPT